MAQYPSDAKTARVTLLGIPIDALTMDQAVNRIFRLLETQRQHHVATPNSEMLVESARNPVFRRVLQQTSLNISDSAGLLWMARLTKQLLPQRVTGVDTMQRFCNVLTPDYPVFFLGAGPGVAEKTAWLLKERNARLKLAGTYAGSPRELDAQEIIARINASNAAVLFVAFGSPAQELWIAKYLPSLTSVRVAMGVGGSFDFIAGVRKRAPRPFQILGLEWLWRLACEPRRFRRIWNAVAVFPFLVLQYRREAPGT
ncbi:MAG: WecB/TagA/CpsF family glycosyltransferase [Candidatus Peribacteraceae bacterium]|nr:WecB/TagA/CpsF family glycosyltransferase [Candidatus Peribacteraceae bacterium]